MRTLFDASGSFTRDSRCVMRIRDDMLFPGIGYLGMADHESMQE